MKSILSFNVIITIPKDVIIAHMTKSVPYFMDLLEYQKNGCISMYHRQAVMTSVCLYLVASAEWLTITVERVFC